MNRSMLFCVSLLLAVFFVGCATRPRIERDRDWQPYVGHYTYSQAVAELGRPYVSGEQSDGTRFAEWIVRRSPQMSFGVGVGGGTFGRGGGVGGGAGTSISPRPRGEYLRLEFGPDNLLRAWSKLRH